MSSRLSSRDSSHQCSSRDSNHTEENSEEVPLCPLCLEELDITDQSFVPCKCGYQVCLWCWHHINEKLNGKCPACRAPYNEDGFQEQTADPELFAKVLEEKKIKKKQEREQKAKQSSVSNSIDLKSLQNVRVMQRNLVYVIGLPPSLAKEEVLKRKEYFGRFGRIIKVAVNKKSHSEARQTFSAYITYKNDKDAADAIKAVETELFDCRQIKATYGTTKYCSFFLRGIPCNNPNCLYLHDLAKNLDCFSKEDLQNVERFVMHNPQSEGGCVTMDPSVMIDQQQASSPGIQYQMHMSSQPEQSVSSSASLRAIAVSDDAHTSSPASNTGADADELISAVKETRLDDQTSEEGQEQHVEWSQEDEYQQKQRCFDKWFEQQHRHHLKFVRQQQQQYHFHQQQLSFAAGQQQRHYQYDAYMQPREEIAPSQGKQTEETAAVIGPPPGLQPEDNQGWNQLAPKLAVEIDSWSTHDSKPLYARQSQSQSQSDYALEWESSWPFARSANSKPLYARGGAFKRESSQHWNPSVALTESSVSQSTAEDSLDVPPHLAVPSPSLCLPRLPWSAHAPQRSRYAFASDDAANSVTDASWW